VESTQAKLDELEKTHDPSKMDSMRKENEVINLLSTDANYMIRK